MAPKDVVRAKVPDTLNVPSMGLMDDVIETSLATRDYGVSDPGKGGVDNPHLELNRADGGRDGGITSVQRLDTDKSSAAGIKGSKAMEHTSACTPPNALFRYSLSKAMLLMSAKVCE
jgi:hypothetical protein